MRRSDASNARLRILDRLHGAMTMHTGTTLALTMLLTTTTIAGDLAITSSTIDCGGGTSSGGAFTLSGTIGQHDAGSGLSGGGFDLAGGFWAGGGAITPPCPADTNGDGSVDVADLLAVLAEWGPCSPSCAADTNGDGSVDVMDLLAVLADWGLCD